jgi:hypothetical protein
LTVDLESGDITRAVLLANTGEYPVNTLAYYHKLGLFRIRAVADPSYRFEDLCGDTYKPEANPDIDPKQLAREKATFRSRVNRMGVWGVLVEVRPSREIEWRDLGPEALDSIWGFVGGDFIGSGYDGDLLSEAMHALEKFPPEATDDTARLVSAATRALDYLKAMDMNGAGYADWRKRVDSLSDALIQFDVKLI